MKTVKDSFKDCCISNINYLIYKEVISRINKKIINRVVNGETIFFKNLGCLYIKKIIRHENNKSINWNECIKDENGKIIKLVYYNDSYYLRYLWDRKGLLENKPYLSYYKLRITKGGNNSENNNIRKLVLANRDNKFLHLKYISNDNNKIYLKYKDNKLIKRYTVKELKEEFGNRCLAQIVKAVSHNNLAYNFNWKCEQ